MTSPAAPTTTSTAPVSRADRGAVGAQPSARRAVARSMASGWSSMPHHELKAVHSWYEIKAAQETGSWPITTAVVGSAAIAVAYMYEHGMAQWDPLRGVTTYGISLLALACAVLTGYRLLAIWRYERRYAEATYWLSLGHARCAEAGIADEELPGR